jgi:hypothetical protein
MMWDLIDVSVSFMLYLKVIQMYFLGNSAQAGFKGSDLECQL